MLFWAIPDSWIICLGGGAPGGCAFLLRMPRNVLHKFISLALLGVCPWHCCLENAAEHDREGADGGSAVDSGMF